MIQFMQPVRAEQAQRDTGTDEGPSDWSEPVNYHCKTETQQGHYLILRETLTDLQLN